MSESYLARLGRDLARIAGAISLYAAPGLSAGSFVSLFHRLLGFEITTAFALGFFAAVGPVYLVYASGWGLKRTLTQLQQMREEGLIQAREYDELRRQALDWFRRKRFG